MNKFIYILCVLWGSIFTVSASVPILIDVEVTGEKDAPTLLPAEFVFQQNKEYLLVLHNPNDYDVVFYYDTFGQNIFSRYLQGTSSVSNDNFSLPAHGKVLWVFSPLAAGEYACYLSNPGINQAGAQGKIVIEAERVAQNVVPTLTSTESSPESTSKAEPLRTVTSHKSLRKAGARRD